MSTIVSNVSGQGAFLSISEFPKCSSVVYCLNNIQMIIG